MSGCFRTFLSALAMLVLVMPASSWADPKHFDTKLSGFNEVHAPSANFTVEPHTFSAGVGAIFSTGDGRLKLSVNERAREIEYELTYEFPDGATTAGAQFVNQAHLHFGQKHTTGGITVWLCGSADVASTPAGTQTCPSPSGTVSGVIRPANVIGLAGQGLPGGQDGFDALLDALRAGAVYGNVHTDRFPPGEIRGQFDKHSHD